MKRIVYALLYFVAALLLICCTFYCLLKMDCSHNDFAAICFRIALAICLTACCSELTHIVVYNACRDRLYKIFPIITAVFVTLLLFGANMMFRLAADPNLFDSLVPYLKGEFSGWWNIVKYPLLLVLSFLYVYTDINDMTTYGYALASTNIYISAAPSSMEDIDRAVKTVNLAENDVNIRLF